jgi:hypothetical protein
MIDSLLLTATRVNTRKQNEIELRVDAANVAKSTLP